MSPASHFFFVQKQKNSEETKSVRKYREEARRPNFQSSQKNSQTVFRQSDSRIFFRFLLHARIHATNAISQATHATNAISHVTNAIHVILHATNETNAISHITTSCNIASRKVGNGRESKGTSEREEGGGMEGGWDLLAGYASLSSPSLSPPLSPPPSLKRRRSSLIDADDGPR